MYRAAREGLLILALAIGLVLLLPVILPAVAVLQARYERRLRAAAERFACLRSGDRLGSVALARADAAWSEHFASLRREHPTWRFRLVRNLHALCPRCGRRYHFDEPAGRFVALDEPGGW